MVDARDVSGGLGCSAVAPHCRFESCLDHLFSQVGNMARNHTMNRAQYMRLADKLFMAQFRSVPCKVCGTKFWCGRPSVGHHLLPKSVYLMRRYSPENMYPLCVVHHDWVETQPAEFEEWLMENDPATAFWMSENKHHRNEKKLDYKTIYEQLLNEEETKKEDK